MDTAVAGRRLAPWLLILLAVAAAGCSSPPRRTASGGPARATTGTRPAPTTLAAPAPGSAGGPATTVAAEATPSTPSVTANAPGPATAAQDALPAGFQPVAYTAVSPAQLWVLGTAACNRPVCTYIASSSDGGRHFFPIPAPPAVASVGPAQPGGVNTLVFADPSDGYAVGVGGSAGGLWATHDAGAHWASYSVGTIQSFTVSGGYAYAVAGDCGNAGCTGVRLLKAATSSPTWTAGTLPIGATTPSSSVTASGPDVWIDVITASGPELLSSQDGGATFAVLRSPCTAGLGGSLKAVSGEFVWALCPTGTEAQAYRSTDAGRSFAALGTGPLPNSAVLVPADPLTAVLLDQATMLRTDDGGASFSPTVRAPATMGWQSASFVSPSAGMALSVARDGDGGVTSTALWATSDGGHTWRQLVVG